MDTCHILLGRPGLFDNHVMHDGHANTYAFNFKGCSLTLAPLPPPKSMKIKLGREVRKASTRVKHEWKESLVRKPLFALLLVESNTSEVVKLLHPLAQSLLREFKDMFPNGLPLGLPPFRGINHQIDLLLGATLPNKLAYRCNPNESKELQRQVQELLDRGYIRESF